MRRLLAWLLMAVLAVAVGCQKKSYEKDPKFLNYPTDPGASAKLMQQQMQDAGMKMGKMTAKPPSGAAPATPPAQQQK